jgi:hypothetical protein
LSAESSPITAGITDDREVPDEASDLWADMASRERTRYLDDLIQTDWTIKVSPPKANRVDASKTKLKGMTRKEVIALLGEPDGDTAESISYKLGYLKPRSCTRKVFQQFGPTIRPLYSFHVHFEGDEGEKEASYIAIIS